jgi:hypothetical protein
MITNEKRILRALIQLGGAATGREISRLLGWTEASGCQRVGNLMHLLIQNNQVERLATGVYRSKVSQRLIHEARSVTHGTS